MPGEAFLVGPSTLPAAHPPALPQITGGDALDLHIGPAAKRLSGATVH